eukprot:1140189-Pelagomonas_calceolata.AAC.3
MMPLQLCRMLGFVIKWAMRPHFDPHSQAAEGPELGQDHGVSNKFQASWLQENERHLWLEDHGKDVDGVYKAGCKWCGTVFARDAGLLAAL